MVSSMNASSGSDRLYGWEIAAPRRPRRSHRPSVRQCYRAHAVQVRCYRTVKIRQIPDDLREALIKIRADTAYRCAPSRGY
ncbi:MAG: hypothetical protein JWR34_4792 [Mycobacterium sp.]|nr:hypothetical protein [Mycobacterium sp.]